jgi:hypothetical protein
MRPNKPTMRLAVAIHKQLVCRDSTSVCELPEASWQQCQVLSRRVQRAQQRGWRLAARRCERDFRAVIDRLYGDFAVIAQDLDDNDRSRRPTATIQDIYHDVLALHDEFEKVSWDHPQQTLSATTEPIELEGVYLGEFEIRLDWGDLVDGHPSNYRVIAVDAHPASSNEDVTHPHVHDEAVCEGDGRVPIRNALEQGRLLDFFMVVRNLLQTYNSGSPHVALSDWDGITCADCGSSTGDDERYTCVKCESTNCDECHYSCSDCGDPYCAECIDRCEGCDDRYCRSCLKRCDKCRVLRCDGCLDEQERCDDCHEEQTEETNDHDTPAGDISDACTTLQPDSMGEVAIPA